MADLDRFGTSELVQRGKFGDASSRSARAEFSVYDVGVNKRAFQIVTRRTKLRSSLVVVVTCSPVTHIDVSLKLTLRVPTGEISKFYSFLVIDLKFYRHVTNS